jgi:hypothetical protein
LTVGLKLGDVAKLGWRGGANSLHNLIVADADSPPPILGIQDVALDDLIPDFVPDLLIVVQAHCAGALTLTSVDRLLDDILIRPSIYAAAVDFAYRLSGRQRAPVYAGHDKNEHQQCKDYRNDRSASAERLHHKKEPRSRMAVVSGSLSPAAQNLKAQFRLAVDTLVDARYSHVLPAAPEAWFPCSVFDRVLGA